MVENLHQTSIRPDQDFELQINKEIEALDIYNTFLIEVDASVVDRIMNRINTIDCNALAEIK